MSRSHDKPRLPPWKGHLGGRRGGAAEMKGPLGKVPDFLGHVLRTSSSGTTQFLLCPDLRCPERKVAQPERNQSWSEPGAEAVRRKGTPTFLATRVLVSLLRLGLYTLTEHNSGRKGSEWGLQAVGHLASTGKSREVNTLKLTCLPALTGLDFSAFIQLRTPDLGSGATHSEQSLPAQLRKTPTDMSTRQPSPRLLPGDSRCV